MPKIDNNKILLQYLHNNKWDDIIKYIKNNKNINVNEYIENGNNIFHLACVKGNTKIIDELIKLKNNGTIDLNIDLGNKKGYTGLHLYYMYGGNNKKYLDYESICIISEKYESLIEYFYDKIELLEIFINNIVKFDCLDNIELSYKSIYYKLIKIYIYYDKIDKKLSNRYFKIIIKLYKISKNSMFVFIAIYYNATKIIDYLISNKYKFTNIMPSELTTPIGYAVKFKNYEILEKILSYIKKSENDYIVYKCIHESSKNYNNRALINIIEYKDTLMMAIVIRYMKPYIEQYKNKYNKTLYFNQFDNNHNTYLHRLLNTKDIKTIPKNFLEFFIKHTDLNVSNYIGETCAHLIFKKGLWKEITDMLVGREIDMLKTDNNSNNCYSYVDKKYNDKLLELTKKIKIPLNVKNKKEIYKIFGIKQMLNMDTNIKKHNYGVFGNWNIHIMLYLKYINDKHSHAYLPKIVYNKKEHNSLMFLFELSSYITNDIHIRFNNNIKYRIINYYSWIPFIICWYDKDKYYIYHQLNKILKTHNNNISIQKQRYVVFYISIIHDKGGHANSLIYDRKNKEAWRFESYGISDIEGKTEINDVHNMDKILKKMLEDVYGKIIYYDPDKYLYGLNFQLVDGEDFVQNIGDPGGYCVAWSIWFMDVVLSNSEHNVEYIMKNFFSKRQISDIITEEEGSDKRVRTDNYYLDFIRRYGHKLDNEKNKILKSIGIKKYDMYSINYKDIDMKKIIEKFKV